MSPERAIPALRWWFFLFGWFFANVEVKITREKCVLNYFFVGKYKLKIQKLSLRFLKQLARKEP